MPRKCISGFAEAGAAMAQQLDDNDLLNLFSGWPRCVQAVPDEAAMPRPVANSSSTISRQQSASNRASSSGSCTWTSATT
jgi:hypothetical protein